MSKYLVDDVLPICCAAYELAGGYTNNKKYEIVHIVKNTLIFPIEQYENVPCCEVTDTHRSLSIEIKDYCKKYLTLSVLGSERDLMESWADAYERQIYEILNNDVLLRKDIGKLAKLPEYYVTFKAKNDIKKKTKFIDTNVELSNDSVISDVECDVVHVIKTKHYPGYNITGIINDCLVTWYSNYTIDTGHYKIEKAVIKEQQMSYYANKLAYRLNNVKGYLIK